MQRIVVIGLIMVFLGVLLVLIGLGSPYLKGEGTVKAGAVVFIGPIPIIFGSDKESAVIVAVLAIVLMAAAYLLFRP